LTVPNEWSNLMSIRSTWYDQTDSISGKSNSEKDPFGCGCFPFILILFISIFAYSLFPASLQPWRFEVEQHVAGDNSEKAQAAASRMRLKAELVDYRNHKYIVFAIDIDPTDDFRPTQSVVHDPDCPCDEN